MSIIDAIGAWANGLRKWWALALGRWTLQGSAACVGYEHAVQCADLCEAQGDYEGAAYWHGRATCRAEAMGERVGPPGLWAGIARGHLEHAIRCRELGASHLSMAYVSGWHDRQGGRVGPGGAL